MDYNNIDEFFKDFIKQYLPYKNSKEFNKLIDYTSDKYLKHLYCDLPSNFKELYEKNSIPISVYNNILYSLGVHKEVVEKLSIKDKISFLFALSDFQRYKGTVKFFKKVAELFSDVFNIYEMYVGQDNVGDWIFKPRLLYEGSDNHNQSIKPFYYVDVYNEVPSLLVQIDQLINLNVTSSAMFPIKSNLVLLEYDFTCYADMLINILVSSILKDYGHINVTLYLKDDIFYLTLLDVYFLWFYIITKSYKISWNNKSVTSVPRFSNRNAYPTSELSKIIYDHKQIKNSYDIQLFYEKYISKKVGTVHSKIENETTMSKSLQKTNNDLYEYLENRLFSISNRELFVIESNVVLNEIYGSLMILDDNSDDELFSTYFSSFLSFLPSMSYIPENTTSYIILKNFKPFHTEFITKANNSIRPTDIATPGDLSNFSIETIRTEFLSEMEETFNIIFTTNKKEEINLSDIAIIRIEKNGKEVIREVVVTEENVIYSINNEIILIEYVVL